MSLIFDIETGPLPEDELMAWLPELDETEFQVGEFDPAAVKVNHLVDQVKIDKKIAEAKAEHERLAVTVPQRIEAARAKMIADLVDSAALSATTGRVLAIGFMNAATGEHAIVSGDERKILEEFWKKVESCKKTGRKLIGHNIGGFDLPFLCQRSWLLSIDVPHGIYERGKWLNERLFADTMAAWSCGQYGKSVKLDVLGRAFGVGGKPDGVSGADFARLWFGSDEDRLKATDYLINDLKLTAAVAVGMGLCS